MVTSPGFELYPHSNNLDPVIRAGQWNQQINALLKRLPQTLYFK